MSYTDVSTLAIKVLGSGQTSDHSFNIPSRLGTSTGLLSVGMTIAANGIVDLSSLLIDYNASLLTPKEKEIGLIALQADNGFDVSLAKDGGEVDIYSGILSTAYIRFLDRNVRHLKIKAGGTAITVTGLVTTGFVV